MIKLNSSFGRSFFSTIRFPQKYKRTFQLNNRIKSSYNLKDLGELVESEKEDMNKYGKTILLEYFCEFPLNHIYRQIDSPLKVFLHCNELKDLTLYETQMKYSCLKKLSLILANQSEDIQKELRKQQSNLFKRSDEFDAIDAINLLIHLKGGDKHNLMEVCLQKICNSPPEILNSMLSRIISMFFKKISTFQGQNLKKFKKIINFLCDDFELSLEIWRLMGTIFQQIVHMKLHMLGYNRIPKIIGQISAKSAETIDKVDIFWLHYVFKGYEQLPINYNNKHLQIIYNQILNRMKRKQHFYIDRIPFKRLKKNQIQKIILTLCQYKHEINPIYITNIIDRHYLFQSQKLIELILKQFLKPISKHQFNERHFANVISTAGILLEHFSEEPQMKLKVQTQLRKHFEVVAKIGNQIIKWMRMLISIPNLATLISLQHKYKIIPDYKIQSQKSLSFRIVVFNKRNSISSNQINKNANNIQQFLSIHASSQIPSIQSCIIKIVKSAIHKDYDVDEDQFSLFIFYLEKAGNSKVYHPPLASLYQRIKRSKERIENLIDNYIRFNNKTTKLNSIFVTKAWKEFGEISYILQIIAGSQIEYFQEIDRLNQNVSSIINSMAALLTKKSFTNLNSSQIIKILHFFHYFSQQTISFSKKLISIVLQLLKQNKILNEYQKICQTSSILIQILKLYRLIQVQTSSQNIAALIAKVDKQLLISNTNNDDKFITLKYIENRIFLKDIFPINFKDIDSQINEILSIITQKSQLQNKGKISFILLKFHSFSLLNLEETKLTALQNIVKQSLSKGQMFPNDIQYILGRQFQFYSLKADKIKLNPLIKLLQFSLTKIEQLQPTSYYIFALRIFHNIKSIDLIQRALKTITTILLQCNELLKILKILVLYPQLQSEYFLNQIVKMIKYKKIDSQQLFYMSASYYINVIYDQIPEKYRMTFQKIYENAENSLLRDAERIKYQKNEIQEKIQQFLSNCYKYYWVAIKDNKITDKTLKIFEISKKYTKYSAKYQDSSILDGINPQLLSIFNQILSSKMPTNVQIIIPVIQAKSQQIIPKQKQKRKTFFKSKTAPKEERIIQKVQTIEEKIVPLIELQDNHHKYLQFELNKKKIPIFDSKNQSSRFYIYGETHGDFKTHYKIVSNGQQIYVHNLKKKLHTKTYGSLNSQVKLWKQIYKEILGKEVNFIRYNSKNFKFL